MGKNAVKMLENLEKGESPENQSMLIDPVLHEGSLDKL